MVVLSTAPNRRIAGRIARTLVKERLVACVNVVPGIVSVYQWKNKVVRDSEVLCILKSRRPLLAKLAGRISALHPYDVPEIIALPITRGAGPYLKWLAAETRTPSRTSARIPPTRAAKRVPAARKGKRR